MLVYGSMVLYSGSSIRYSPRTWQNGSFSSLPLHQLGKRVWLSSKILSMYASRICDQVYKAMSFIVTVMKVKRKLRECKMTYSEFSNLDRVGNRIKNPSFFIHCKNKSNTCCRFAIAVYPFILFWNCKQMIKGYFTILNLS